MKQSEWEKAQKAQTPDLGLLDLGYPNSYLASQHLIEQNSKSPPVHWLSIRLVSDDLKQTHSERKA